MGMYALTVSVTSSTKILPLLVIIKAVLQKKECIWLIGFFYYILIGSNAVYPITDSMGLKETLVVKAGHPSSTISVDDCFFTVLCYSWNTGESGPHITF